MQYLELDKKIAQLNHAYNKSVVNERYCWKELWSEIRDIGASFKGTRYPSRHSQNAAWDRYQEVIQKIKETQGREFEKRNEVSSRHYANIQRLCSAAEPEDALTGIVKAITGIGIADQLLNSWLDTDGDHNQLRRRSDAMKNAWDYLSDNKIEMDKNTKSRAYNLLEKTRIRLDEDWRKWKEYRRASIAERNREREERKEKQEKWRINQMNWVRHLERAEDKLETALVRRREHLGKLRVDYGDAWSDSYRNRVQKWMNEEHANIREVELKLADVRHKLSEARVRLEKG